MPHFCSGKDVLFEMTRARDCNFLNSNDLMTYVYYENVSKNRNGSFKQEQSCSLKAFTRSRSTLPCQYPWHIHQQVPLEAKEKDLFYIRPLDKVATEPNSPWYSAVPLGKHTLQSKMKYMCASGGIKGHKTNHSLRATAATEMFRCGAPEKLMQERTGHWSVEALQTYQHLEESQHKIVSSLLFTLTDLSTRFFRSNSYLQLHFNSSNSYATDISSKSQGKHDQ